MQQKRQAVSITSHDVAALALVQYCKEQGIHVASCCKNLFACMQDETLERPVIRIHRATISHTRICIAFNPMEVEQWSAYASAHGTSLYQLIKEALSFCVELIPEEEPVHIEQLNRLLYRRRASAAIQPDVKSVARVSSPAHSPKAPPIVSSSIEQPSITDGESSPSAQELSAMKTNLYDNIEVIL